VRGQLAPGNEKRTGILIAVPSRMVEAQILFGAVSTLAAMVLVGRRFRSRSTSLEVDPVSSGWLAERRRIREDLVG
jgi:hypothetical protein